MVSGKNLQARLKAVETALDAPEPDLATVRSADSVRSNPGPGLAMLPYLTINDIIALRSEGFQDLEDLEKHLLAVPEAAWEHVLYLVEARIIEVNPHELDDSASRPPTPKAVADSPLATTPKAATNGKEPELAEEVKTRCLALTRAGDRCQHKARPESWFCASHKSYEPEPPEVARTGADGNPRCLALTKSGDRCQNPARGGSKYCASHKGYQPSQVELALVHGKGNPRCLALTKSGDRCQNSTGGGAKYCSAHEGYQPTVEEVEEDGRLAKLVV